MVCQIAHILNMGCLVSVAHSHSRDPVLVAHMPSICLRHMYIPEFRVDVTTTWHLRHDALLLARQILGTTVGTLRKTKFRKSFGSLIPMGLTDISTYVIT